MKKFDCIIVSPFFNENSTLIAFLKDLEKTLSPSGLDFLLILVNDGSYDNTLELLRNFSFKFSNFELKIINLKFNVGHQKAIYQGLLYASKLNVDRVIVMDSDGEDDPHAILELIKIQNFDIVFVVRGKRKERLGFKLGYLFYKLLFKIIINTTVNFGNFSMISNRALHAVVGQSYIHYPAFLSKLRLQKAFIKSDRRKRLDGKSQMNYQSLVMHGLKALVEYSDKLLIFFMLLFFATFICLTIIGGFILYQKIFTDAAILGWASTLGSSLINACLIILGIIVLGLMLLNINEKAKDNVALYLEKEEHDTDV